VNIFIAIEMQIMPSLASETMERFSSLPGSMIINISLARSLWKQVEDIMDTINNAILPVVTFSTNGSIHGHFISSVISVFAIE
jgi:hypothetical protein